MVTISGERSATSGSPRKARGSTTHSKFSRSFHQHDAPIAGAAAGIDWLRVQWPRGVAQRGRIERPPC